MADNIYFSDAHHPKLATGEYELMLDHELKAAGVGENNHYIFASKTYNFFVGSERFSINPQEIQSVFPPDGSLGDYSTVLPHIVLTRSTLPWERTALDKAEINEGDPPWLALLVFQEGEIKEQEIVDLKSAKSMGIKLITEITESGDERMNLIWIKKDLINGVPAKNGSPAIRGLLPQNAEDLKYLVHTRHDETLSGKGNEKAVVIATRLPEAGKSTIVHLVSLEHHYYKNGKLNNWQKGSGDKALIPFISLKSWRFSCMSTDHNLGGRIKNLNKKDKTIQLPTTLRLPDTTDQNVNKYLMQGFVALPHRFREGSKSVSWYRGPLATGKMEVNADLPVNFLAKALTTEKFPEKGKHQSDFDIPLVKTGDLLLQFHIDNGFFDVSNAAAWELGRMLALRNKGFATHLSRWKKSCRRSQKMIEEELSGESSAAHIPYSGPGKTSDVSDLQKWIKDLFKLEGIPFNYLIPDERLVPPESLRFFYLNQNWMASLLDGVLSIGGKMEAFQLKELFEGTADNKVEIYKTGFIMRSSIVSGFPGLHIEAPGTQKKVPGVRRKLGPNLLLCLFKEEFSEVDFFLNPEVLHFGFHLDGTSGKKFKKTLRKKSGQESTIEYKFTLPDNRVVDFSETTGLRKFFDDNKSALDFSKTSPARLAISLIEGTDKFKLKKMG